MTRRLIHLLMVAMLFINTSPVWAQLGELNDQPAPVSHSKPCHAEQVLAQDSSAVTGHGCCDTGHDCTSGCKCPAMTSAVLFDQHLLEVIAARPQLLSVPQATPIYIDPSLFLHPPRKSSL